MAAPEGGKAKTPLTLLPGLADGRFAADLLAWYDVQARALPWRTPPQDPTPPDPYAVWLSEVMLQQTTVAAVTPRYAAFLARWPTVAALAEADEGEVMAAWAGLGYYARARNLIACAKAVASLPDGAFPDTEDALRRLPGIGDYTAAAVAAIAFGRRAVVVDANIQRIAIRLAALPDPPAAARRKVHQVVDTLMPPTRSGDVAQALMDLGSGVCTPKSPRCLICPVAAHCRARAEGLADALPVRAARKARPVRHGTAWWIVDDDRVWLVRRPGRGLLGGMRALPGDEWTPVAPQAVAGPVVTHVFTHFELRLALEARGRQAAVGAGEWWPLDRLGTAGLPTLYTNAARAMGARMDEP